MTLGLALVAAGALLLGLSLVAYAAVHIGARRPVPSVEPSARPVPGSSSQIAPAMWLALCRNCGRSIDRDMPWGRWRHVVTKSETCQ